MSKGGQYRRDKKGRTHGCTCSRGCLFYTEFVVDSQCRERRIGEKWYIFDFLSGLTEHSVKYVGHSEYRRQVDQKGRHCSIYISSRRDMIPKRCHECSCCFSWQVFPDAADQTELRVAGQSGLTDELVHREREREWVVKESTKILHRVRQRNTISPSWVVEQGQNRLARADTEVGEGGGGIQLSCHAASRVSPASSLHDCSCSSPPLLPHPLPLIL